MKNPLVKIAGILALSAALIFFGRDLIIQASVGSVCRATTGLNLAIGGFHSDLLASTISVRDLKLFNPRGYSEKIMFAIPELRVGFDPGSLFAGKPHLREVRLHLARLVIERNKEGKLNLSELKPSEGKKKASSAKPSGASGMRIDLLTLQIDKVIYKDFSKAIPQIQEFDLNINETYRDIKDVRALAPIIIGDVLKNRLLGSLVNFRVSDLLQNFEAGGIDIADLGLDQISGVLNSGIGQTAKDIFGSVGGQLGSLFGGSAEKKG